MENSSSTNLSSIDSQNALLAPPINSTETHHQQASEINDTSTLDASTTVVNVPPGAFYYAEPGTTEMFNIPSAPAIGEGNYCFQPTMVIDQSKLDYYPPPQQMVTIPQTTVQVIAPVESTNTDYKNMFQLGVALAIISWVLQLFGVTLFALIAVIAAQVILWNNYHSHQHSLDETKRMYAQKSRKMAITHLIVSILMVVIGVAFVTLSTVIVVVAYVIVYVVVIVTATSTTSR